MKQERQHPPRLLMRFFRWFCTEELRDYVEGDLEELYLERYRESGRARANWRFAADVLLLFRPGIIGFSKNYYGINQYDMIRNHFKVGARNLWKDRFYTLINLIGLSTGLAFSFLVLLLVNYEFSFERFYENEDSIFRLGVHYTIDGKEDSYSNVPRPLGPAFKAEFPELVDYTRVAGVNGLTEHRANLKYEQQHFTSGNIFVADSSFFNVFDTQLIRGKANNVLNRPNTTVISESIAKTIFGDTDPVGKEIEILENGKRLEITGVFEDIPANTHLPYDVLVSWFNYYDEADNNLWYGRHVYTYMRLHRADQASAVMDKFPAFFDKYMLDTHSQLNSSAELIIQPISEVHLKSDLNWEPNKNGDETSAYILLAIGIFLVVIAQVNYLNLSLARSSLRKKEISVRKVIGASKGNISGQFIVETMLFTLLAATLSLVLVKLIYPEFVALTGVNVWPFSSGNLLIFGLVTLGLGLMVSFYPSLILSGVHLVDGLKGRSKKTRESGRLQRMLVVFQFMISTLVILFTYVVKNQLDYVLNKDLGFNKENLAVFQLSDTVLTNRISLLKDRIGEVAGVNSVAFAFNRPGIDLNHTILNAENEGEYPSVSSQFMQIDADFENTVGLELIEGRSFIEGSISDANEHIMVNEAARTKFGWGTSAVGKKVSFGRDQEGNPVYMSVIGVFKDFNIGSLHSGIEPIVAFYVPFAGDQLLIRLSGDQQASIISSIERIFDEFNPNVPASFHFINDELDKLYADEKLLSSGMTWLSILTIIISVLGFVGLLSFSISQREKEIGIRKVLGAKVASVTALFYREILLLIIVAQVIAVPLNYYLSSQWLESFEYRVFPGLVEVAVVLLTIILLSLGTMAFQIVRVALLNPARVIKDE